MGIQGNLFQTADTFRINLTFVLNVYREEEHIWDYTQLKQQPSNSHHPFNFYEMKKLYNQLFISSFSGITKL